MKPPSDEDGLFCLGYEACLRALALESESSHAKEDEETRGRLGDITDCDRVAARQERVVG